MSPRKWIKTKEGPKQIDAELVPGIKGIFLNKDKNKKAWVITHRRSGLRVGSYFFKRRQDAALVATLLTEEEDIDWTIKDPDELVLAHPGMQTLLSKIVMKHVDEKRRKYDGRP